MDEGFSSILGGLFFVAVIVFAGCPPFKYKNKKEWLKALFEEE